jgi:serine/threonine-protein kinase
MLFRRAIDQVEAVPMRDTEDAAAPFFSPDGRWVGFFTPSALKKVPVDGGPATTITAVVGQRYGASWGVNDVIVFAAGGSPNLMRVPAAGGKADVAVPASTFKGASLRWPSWTSDAKAIAFTVFGGLLSTSRVALHSITSGESHIVADGTQPIVTRDDQLLFAAGGSLWSVHLDSRRLAVTGSPIPVLEGLMVNSGGLASFTVAGNGSLAFIPGEPGGRRVVWATREGGRQPLLDKPQSYVNPRLSPDGRRMAVQIDSDTPEGGSDIWVYDLGSKSGSRLTLGHGRHVWPVWMPNGDDIIYAAQTSDNVTNLFRIAADGSGTPVQVTKSSTDQIPCAVTDGQVVFGAAESGGKMAIMLMPLDGRHEPRTIVHGTVTNTCFAVSPNGRYVAYTSSESGSLHIYVHALTGLSGTWQISTEGRNNEPQWSADGKELFFRALGVGIMAAPVDTGPRFAHGTPHLLVRYPAVLPSLFSVTRDGQQFLLAEGVGLTGVSGGPDQTPGGSNPSIIVTLNWLDELTRRVPATR